MSWPSFLSPSSLYDPSAVGYDPYNLTTHWSVLRKAVLIPHGLDVFCMVPMFSSPVKECFPLSTGGGCVVSSSLLLCPPHFSSSLTLSSIYPLNKERFCKLHLTHQQGGGRGQGDLWAFRAGLHGALGLLPVPLVLAPHHGSKQWLSPRLRQVTTQYQTLQYYHVVCITYYNFIYIK